MSSAGVRNCPRRLRSAAAAGVLDSLGLQFQGGRIHSHHIAMIQAAVKLSRLTLSPNHEDSWVDLTGYAACGYECATLEADPLSSAPVATGIGDGEEERGDQGHRSGSVQARYSHVTAEMRRRLLADLTRVWTEAVEARRRLNPESPVGVLDRLLRPS